MAGPHATAGAGGRWRRTSNAGTWRKRDGDEHARTSSWPGLFRRRQDGGRARQAAVRADVIGRCGPGTDAETGPAPAARRRPPPPCSRAGSAAGPVPLSRGGSGASCRVVGAAQAADTSVLTAGMRTGRCGPHPAVDRDGRPGSVVGRERRRPPGRRHVRSGYSFSFTSSSAASTTSRKACERSQAARRRRVHASDGRAAPLCRPPR